MEASCFIALSLTSVCGCVFALFYMRVGLKSLSAGLVNAKAGVQAWAALTARCEKA